MVVVKVLAQHHHQVDMAEVSLQFRGAVEEFRLKQSRTGDHDTIRTRVRGEELRKGLGQCLQILPENFSHKTLK